MRLMSNSAFRRRYIGTIVGSIVSNMFRTDMTVLEHAAAYQKLVDAGLTVQEIARRLTKDRKTVTNGLAVAALPLEVKDWCSLAMELSIGLAISEPPESKTTTLYASRNV